METNQLPISSVPNKPEFDGYSYLPEEIWHKIGGILPFNDAKSFRLVNRTLRRNSTDILRKSHRPICFRSTQKLHEFLALLLPNSGELPFSTLQFDLPSLGPVENVGILTQIANMIGGDIRELRFLEPLDLEKSTPLDEFHSGYSQCLSIFLARVPHLSCLKMNVYDYRVSPSSELLLPEVFLHLKKLKLRLMFTCGSLVGVETLRKIIQRSPSLEELSIHAGARFFPKKKRDKSRVVLLGLPDWLDCLPERCTVKLRLWKVTDDVKLAVENLKTCRHIQLSAVAVHSHDLTDPETSELFWGWMASQPLRKLKLENNSIFPRPQPNPPPFRFPNCTKLILGNLSDLPPMDHDGHFQFPNLCHVKLGSINSESLKKIAMAFPQIQRLSVMSGSVWDTLVGGDVSKVFEFFLGVRSTMAEESTDCPIQGFKCLRILELTVSINFDLLAVVYASSRGILQKLESLNLTFTQPMTADEVQRYEDALSAHHAHVTLRRATRKESWWNSHRT